MTLVTILEQNETIKLSTSGGYKTLQAHTHFLTVTNKISKSGNEKIRKRDLL